MSPSRCKKPFKKPAISGFTLAELLIAVAIVSIMVAIAVPSFNRFISNARMVSETNHLVEAINIARSKAVSTHWNTVVAKTGGNWNGGFRVFSDRNNNQTEDIGELIQNYGPLDGDITIKSTATFSDFVIYRPDGRLAGIGGSYYICSDSEIADYRRIVIAATGRIRTLSPYENGEAYNANCP